METPDEKRLREQRQRLGLGASSYDTPAPDPFATLNQMGIFDTPGPSELHGAAPSSDFGGYDGGDSGGDSGGGFD
jgi:hypothetical protein